MIRQLLTTEYLFWLVALSFYFISNIKLVDKLQLLFTESFTGKFKPSFNFNTFEIIGKQVQLLNLFTPFTGFFKLNIAPNELPSKDFEKTNYEIIAFQKATFPFKVISLISFFYLILGPALTFHYGLGAALFLLFPIHLLTLLFTLILLLIGRNKLGFEYGTIALIFFDCLVVPAYLPNIVRKLYSKKQFSCDGFYFLLQNAEAYYRKDLEHCISRKINQTIESVDDSDLQNFYLYKKTLGISND